MNFFKILAVCMLSFGPIFAYQGEGYWKPTQWQCGWCDQWNDVIYTHCTNVECPSNPKDYR